MTITVNNLGVMVYTATFNGYPGLRKIGSGPVRSHWHWYHSDSANVKNNVVILNHDDGTTQVLEGGYGRPWGIIQHPNGLTYVGGDRGTSFASYLWAWNQETGVVSDNIYAFPTSPSYFRPQCLIYADDANKTIFIGQSNGTGKLLKYDPVTDTGTDLGVIDSDGIDSDRYIYTMQADAGYVYMNMRQGATHPADDGKYIAILKISDNSVTTWLKSSAGITNLNVYYGVDGFVYTLVTGGASAGWWKMNGQAAPDSVSEPTYYNIGTKWVETYAGYDASALDFSLISPNIDKVVTLQYKRTGDSDYRTVDVTLLTVDDYLVQRAADDLDDNIICVADFYGRSAKLNTTTDLPENLGGVSYSAYGITKDEQRKLIWFSGYPGKFAQYNPAQAWSSSNPALITLSTHSSYTRYFWWATFGVDKWIYLTMQIVRTGAGDGCLVCYNPDDSSEIAIDLPNYEPTSMAINRAKSIICLSCYPYQFPANGIVYVIPLKHRAVTKEIVPQVGLTNPGKLVCVETADPATNGNFVGITFGASYKVYAFNVHTGQLLWGPLTKTGTSWSGMNTYAAAPTFAGEYVWFFVGTDLCKVDPTNGDVTVVQAMDAAGQIVWVENVAYVFGTNKIAYKVTGLI